MSKLNRSEFKELLTEWKQNFINEFRDSSKEKQTYFFNTIENELKKSGSGGGGNNGELQKRRGGGGGGKSIYATWWYDMTRFSLTRPEENELDAESKDYVDPSIKDPDHFFFDQKKYTDYLDNQENLDRDYHDYMIDLQLKAIHNITPITNKGNISDNNWYMALYLPESSHSNYLSFKLEDSLKDLSSCKVDNILEIRFVPKSKEMSELLKRGKGIFNIFSSSHEIIVDTIDCRDRIFSTPRFYMSTMSQYLEEVSPFNFSTNREEDLEALYEALSGIIEDCDLAYDLDVEVSKKGYIFSKYENELDEFEVGNREESLERNLNLLYKKLNGGK